MRVLVIDNYDSFTFNLVQYLGELGADPQVFRNDELQPEAARGRPFDRLVISPGPGRPEASARSYAGRRASPTRRSTSCSRRPTRSATPATSTT